MNQRFGLYGFLFVVLFAASMQTFAGSDKWVIIYNSTSQSNTWSASADAACGLWNYAPAHGYFSSNTRAYCTGTAIMAVRKYGSCAGETVVALDGSCAACEAPTEYDPITRQCIEFTCPEGQEPVDDGSGTLYCSAACEEVIDGLPGQERDPVTLECVALPIDCTGQEPAVATLTKSSDGRDVMRCVLPSVEGGVLDDCLADKGTMIVDLTYESPVPTGCLDAPELGCTNITGKTDFDTVDATFDYCQERALECAAQGGTYGAIGSESSGTGHVCLMGAPNVPVCSSGAALYYVENPDGSGGMTCTPTTPPNDTCDATKYDCDGDGNVDDQDKDGVVDNGTENLHNQGGGGSNTGGSFGGNTGDFSGTVTDPNSPYYGENIGEDKLNPAAEGTGKCDPTATNYADCIGLTGGDLGEIEDGANQGIIDGIANQVDSITSGMFDQVSDAIGDGDAGIAGPTGLASTITGGIFDTTCSDLSFDFYGTNLVVSCSKLEPLRIVLAWVCSILTMFYLWHIATKPTER